MKCIERAEGAEFISVFRTEGFRNENHMGQNKKLSVEQAEINLFNFVQDCRHQPSMNANGIEENSK